jgi:hypothetical protein
MKIIKAFSIIAVAAVLLLAGWAVPPVAATSGVTVSVDTPAAVDPGSGFAASISINEVTDFDACNYDVTFDALVLQLDDVTAGLIGSTAVPVDMYSEVSAGTYRIIQNVPGLSGANGSGYLADLHFHVIGTAGDNSPVDLSNGVISDTAAVEIEATWVEGVVMVVTEASQANPPLVASSSPESIPLPPDSNEPAQLLPPSSPSDGSDGVPVLWLVVGGAGFLGLIILFLIARSRAY